MQAAGVPAGYPDRAAEAVALLTGSLTHLQTARGLLGSAVGGLPGRFAQKYQASGILHGVFGGLGSTDRDKAVDELYIGLGMYYQARSMMPILQELRGFPSSGMEKSAINQHLYNPRYQNQPPGGRRSRRAVSAQAPDRIVSDVILEVQNGIGAINMWTCIRPGGPPPAYGYVPPPMMPYPQ